MTELYERDGFYHFVVYELAEESNELKMLMSNEVCPVLPRELRYIDGVPRLCYHIEGRQTIQHVYEKAQIDYEVLSSLLKSICQVFRQLREYLLCYDDLLLDPEHIYWNWEQTSFEYIYFPGYGSSIGEQLLRLIEFLMHYVDYQDERGAGLIYRLYEAIRRKGASVELLNRFCEEGQEVEGEGVRTNRVYLGSRREPEEADANGSSSLQDRHNEEIDFYMEEPKWKRCLYSLWQKVSRHRENGKVKQEEQELVVTAIEDEVSCQPVCAQPAGATTLLSMESPSLRLEPELQGILSIVPGEEKQVIGRQKKICDYLLESPEISRVHACIVRRGEDIVLADLNSSNGTYVNGERLPIQEEIVLKKDDRVSFGSIRFRVV